MQRMVRSTFTAFRACGRCHGTGMGKACFLCFLCEGKGKLPFLAYADELTAEEFESLSSEQKKQAIQEFQAFKEEQATARKLALTSEWEKEVTHLVVYKGKSALKLSLDQRDSKGELELNKEGAAIPINYAPNKRVSGMKVDRLLG